MESDRALHSAPASLPPACPLLYPAPWPAAPDACVSYLTRRAAPGEILRERAAAVTHQGERGETWGGQGGCACEGGWAEQSPGVETAREPRRRTPRRAWRQRALRRRTPQALPHAGAQVQVRAGRLRVVVEQRVDGHVHGHAARVEPLEPLRAASAAGVENCKMRVSAVGGKRVESARGPSARAGRRTPGTWSWARGRGRAARARPRSSPWARCGAGEEMPLMGASFCFSIPRRRPRTVRAY